MGLGAHLSDHLSDHLSGSRARADVPTTTSTTTNEVIAAKVGASRKPWLARGGGVIELMVDVNRRHTVLPDRVSHA